MKLHIVDILIICAYLMVIVAIGLFLKKKAAKNMDSYFLGGKSLPFYMLGLSNASATRKSSPLRIRLPSWDSSTKSSIRDKPVNV